MNRSILAVLAALIVGISFARGQVVYEGGRGPGKGKHLVFLAGDEEYRSEEALPQLAKILSERHGFKCTVLFSLNAAGEIDPNTQTNQPGLEALASADACFMLLRFRQWPDEQMKHFVDYYLAGKPIIALRTSTHAFSYNKDSKSAYRKFHWQSREWPGGFGKQVLGETWVTHWGVHKKEATAGVIEAAAKDLPLLRGVNDVFGDTDVYEAAPPADATILMRGRVLKGMNPSDPPAEYSKKTVAGVQQDVNNPMMPVAWSRNYRNEAGKTNLIVTTTLGSATDLQSEGFRRFLVNAAYVATGLEQRIPEKSNVDFVGTFRPTMYGFNGGKKGVKPADHQDTR